VNRQPWYRYFIRVTNVEVFNLIFAAVERLASEEEVQTARRYGYYELRTANAELWREIYLYGQIIAQHLDEYIEAGEDSLGH
jgi:hypothetical protein